MSGCCGNDGEGRRSARRTLAILGVAGALAGGLGIASLPALPRATAAPAGDGCCGGGDAAEPAKAVEGGSDHGGAAGAAKAADAPAEEKGLLVDLANGKCPIMGGKPDGRTFSEWNGLRVGHCCPMCTGKFGADPETALKKAGIEWKAAAAAARKVDEAKTPEDRAAALKALRAKWTVVREPGARAEQPALLVDLGNGKCPIMGGKPDGRTFSEWNGLRVGHCCPMCIGKFGADPEAALKKAGIEWKDAAAALKRVRDAKTPEEGEKALAALKKKWSVVEPAKESGKDPKK